MKRISLLLCWIVLFQSTVFAQQFVESLDLESLAPNRIHKLWLKVIDNGMAQPVYIPVLIAKGRQLHPVLGLTAAIHGNELNGIPIIHQLFADLDPNSLNGTILAVPGLNAISLPLHERRYVDEEDLNRLFPGKENGNRSQQYVWQIKEKLLPHLDYLVDMHTASFGRENTLYVRADLDDFKISQMAGWLDADIILNNKGVPSASERMNATRTFRAEAVLKGIPAITVEYGNPQVYQSEMIERGLRGIQNLLIGLQLTSGVMDPVPHPVICQRSYWIFTQEGGYLEIHAELGQLLKKDQLIATLRDPFGQLIKQYYAPEAGVVIGKSSNPVNMSGGRILHLGVIAP